MKLFFLSSFFIALSFLTRGADGSVKTEIILDNHIEVSSKNEYSWFDLVRVVKPNALLLKKLAEIKLPSSFFVGLLGSEPQSLTRERVLRIIKNSELKDLGLWQVPEVVSVRVIEQASADEIQRKVINQLRTQCGDCDFEVAAEKIPTLKARHWKLNVSDLMIKNSLLIPFEGDGKSIWISARIKAYKNAPVTTRLISALQKIQPGDLEIKRVNMSNFKDGFLTIDQMIGMTMNRTLSVGTPVGASDVKREAVIKKGQMIKALVESADFEINANAMAEESGYVGDVIKVRSSDNQKLMMGKIKDNNSVVIQ